MALSLGLAFLGPMVGCAGKPPQVRAQPIAAEQYRPLYESAIHTLRNFGFQIERRDYRHGIITTAPLGSPTIFEPWKRTASTPSQALAGTFSDLRRRVKVELKPREPSGQERSDKPYGLRVEAMIERREEPVQRMPGASSISIYANLSQVPVELQRRGIESGYWQPIARDRPLERRLLQAILHRPGP